MDRILCAWSPAWAIDNWRRRRPSAAPAEAFALTASDRGTRRLTAVNAGAAARGLFVGQKAADARALVPDLVLDEADPQGDAAALEALAEACARFSPAVAVDPPDGLFLDITGLAHLWGGEAALAADLTGRLARRGVTLRTAVAGTPGAAWALARFGGGSALVPQGGEAAALAPLPTAALRLEPADAAQLARLGLMRVSALAALPRAQLSRRFGPGVVLRLDQALGAVREALAYRRPPVPWLERLAFAEPISTPQDMAAASAEAARRLCDRLEAAGRGARCFELAFHRLDGAVRPVTAGLARPDRDPAALVRLLAAGIERVDPGFGVEVVTLAAEDVHPMTPRQDRLDGVREPDQIEADLAPLIDRLAGRLGPASVWRPRAFPSHMPERAVRRAAPLEPPVPAPRGGWSPDRPRPLRLLDPPEPVEAVAAAPDEPPALFRWRGLLHRVRRAEGPERLAEEWWRRPIDTVSVAAFRDYYRVEDDSGGRFWLFRDGPYGADPGPRWWLHGLFG